MTDDRALLEAAAPMSWRYLPEWSAWWLMLPSDGVSEQRGYGPFNETEAVWAGEVHGIPFRAAASLSRGERMEG